MIKTVKNLKKVGIGGLVVGGSVIGAIGVAKAVNDHNRNKAAKSVKERVLKG